MLNEYQGAEITTMISREFLEGAFKPKIGVIWKSENLVDYYYGVLGNEATAGRGYYKGDIHLCKTIGHSGNCLQGKRRNQDQSNET